MDQIDYLEKLLTGYKSRFAAGEKDLADRIKVTAARLDELKLKKHYEDQKARETSKAPRLSVIQMQPRGCCRGR